MLVMYIVYQKALIQTFHSSFLTNNNLCEFTMLEHEFKVIWTQNSVLNVRFKDFGILTQIWYDEFN